jgi:hypothetical protein
MKRLSHEDGSWAALTKQWEQQCHKLDEDFQTYLPDTIKLLGELVEQTKGNQHDGVFAHVDSGQYRGICFMNGAFIPGYTGRVLRVRHVILAPDYDYGDYDERDFAEILGGFFENIIDTSENVIICNHVKIHFRSPADVAVFRRFSEEMSKFEHFSSVLMKGAWLMITKC